MALSRPKHGFESHWGHSETTFHEVVFSIGPPIPSREDQAKTWVRVPLGALKKSPPNRWFFYWPSHPIEGGSGQNMGSSPIWGTRKPPLNRWFLFGSYLYVFWRTNFEFGLHNVHPHWVTAESGPSGFIPSADSVGEGLKDTRRLSRILETLPYRGHG